MRWLQTREDGYTRRKYYVYECQLDGDWWEMFDGKVWSDGWRILTHSPPRWRLQSGEGHSGHPPRV